MDALDEEAEKFLDAGDDQGLAERQEILVRERGAVADHVKRVHALVEREDARSAIAAGRHATAAYPDNARVHHELAHACLLEDRFVEALASIDRAITLGDDLAFTCLRAHVPRELGEFEELIKEARAALDRDPGHWHSLQPMVGALVPPGRLDEAETRANDLVELAPDQPAALLTASRFFHSPNRLDRALQLVDRALDLDDDNLRSRHLRVSFSLIWSTMTGQERNFVISYPGNRPR